MYKKLEILADGMMTCEQASTYLGLALVTLAKKRCNGTGPKFTKRGRVLYFREDLDEWLRAGRVGSCAEARSLTR